jgi:hypothetical protein
VRLPAAAAAAAPKIQLTIGAAQFFAPLRFSEGRCGGGPAVGDKSFDCVVKFRRFALRATAEYLFAFGEATFRGPPTGIGSDGFSV